MASAMTYDRNSSVTFIINITAPSVMNGQLSMSQICLEWYNIYFLFTNFMFFNQFQNKRRFTVHWNHCFLFMYSDNFLARKPTSMILYWNVYTLVVVQYKLVMC